MRVGDFGLISFLPEPEGKDGDLPAFRFSSWKGSMLATLPDPPAAFGLYLDDTKVTDEGLKELAGLKSLQALVLSETPVTDAGLKALAELKSLQSLDLDVTGILERAKELGGSRACNR